jgi:hypothetical protein
MPSKLRIIVSGMIAATPYQGGATWAVLQYVLGLRRLGHEVLFVESLKGAAIQPANCRLDSSRNATYFRGVMTAFDLNDASALIDAETRQTVGLPIEHLEAYVRTADVVVNIAGSLSDELEITRIPIRLYLDLDPAFTQIWHTEYGVEMGFDRHTHFATIGQTIGQSGGSIPDCGRSWVPIWQPIVLSHWPVARDITYDAYTTIANWRSYGSVEHGGIFYGQKAHSLRRFFQLPAQVDAAFILALAIHPDEKSDLAALIDNGWSLLDPADVTGTPSAYQSFIQGSKAEIGIAKDGYATARCGWFSDRSVCYLASGRPVIAQETGFSDYLPTGNGLFAFKSAEDVADAIELLNRNYAHHQRSARAIATEYFDSDRVLGKLLRQIGVW